MTLNDRFTKGFIAGVIAGIFFDIVVLISVGLGISEKAFWVWSGTIIFGFKPHTTSQILLSAAGQIFFSGVMGVIFVYLIPQIRSTNLYLKGWVFGLVVWFSTYAITLFFNIEPLIPIYVDTAATDFVSASVYGLVLAYTLKRFEERTHI